MLNTTLRLNKDELVRRSLERMREELSAPARTVPEKVALTCRILHARGHDSGLAGQISARAGASYFTQRLGLGFNEITEHNLLQVDGDLRVLKGKGMANPANRFHSWIYAARPDVACIVHTHALHTSALSMLATPLVVSHMDSCMLYDDVAFLPEWPGVPVGNDEGQIIADALGDRRAVLLAHHGLVVAARSVEEACVIAVQFERTAQLQLLASSAGTIKPIPEALAREAHDWILTSQRSAALFEHYVRTLGENDRRCTDVTGGRRTALRRA